MKPELKREVYQTIAADRNRRGEHQETLGLRLTKEQMAFLRSIETRFHIKRGAYLKRILIKEMVICKDREERQCLEKQL